MLEEPPQPQKQPIPESNFNSPPPIQPQNESETTEPANQQTEEEKITRKKLSISSAQPQAPVEPPKIVAQTIGSQQEKKEFFSRETIRTMRKDLARLQEEGALQERERLAKLKTEEELKTERTRIEHLRKEEEERMFAKAEVLQKEREHLRLEKTDKVQKELKEAKEQTEQATRKKEWVKPAYKLPFALPKKPSGFDKLFARFVLTAVFIALWGIIITFWYWYLIVRSKENVPPPPTSQNQEEPQQPSEGPLPPEEPQQQRPLEPVAFIPVNQTTTIEFSATEELPSLFKEVVQQYGGENTFTRLLLYDKQRNNWLVMQEFFQIFAISNPEGLMESLNPNFTLFVYSSKIANRLGFITTTENPEAVKGLMQQWEQTLEQDMNTLFSLLGKQESAQTSSFRQATYRGVNFRYISFPSINFGAVWTIASLSSPENEDPQYYLLFTSSGESMMRTIDQLLKTMTAIQ